MTKLLFTRWQLFLFRLHELFSNHNFKLIPTGYGSYRAKCSCGVVLMKGAPMQAVK